LLDEVPRREVVEEGVSFEGIRTRLLIQLPSKLVRQSFSASTYLVSLTNQVRARGGLNSISNSSFLVIGPQLEYFSQECRRGSAILGWASISSKARAKCGLG
jgi:hypothetical protein